MPTPMRALVILVVLLSVVLGGAGGVIPRVETCPVCAEEFSFFTPTSCIIFPSTPDQFGTGMWREEALRTCPHCLYTAMRRDFTDITPAEAQRIRDGLPTLGTRMRAEMRALLGVDPADLVDDRSVLHWFVARVHYERRDDPEELHLLRHLYNRTGYRGSDVTNHERARELFVAALRERLAPPAALAGDRALWAYILARVLREAGDIDDAAARFAEVRALVGPGHWLDPLAAIHIDRIESADWSRDEIVAALAIAPERDCFDDREQWRVRHALARLATADDGSPEEELALEYVSRSWLHAIVFVGVAKPGPEYLAARPRVRVAFERMAATLATLEPTTRGRFGSQLHRTLATLLDEGGDLGAFSSGMTRYERIRRETREAVAAALPDWLAEPILGTTILDEAVPMSALAKRHGLSVGRLLDLNPTLLPGWDGRALTTRSVERERHIVPAGTEITVVRAAAAWTADPNDMFSIFEAALLEGLAPLLARDEPDAAAYFERWVGTLRANPTGFLGMDDCFDAVRGKRELCRRLSAAAQEPRLAAAFTLAGGDRSVTPSIVERLKAAETWDWMHMLALREMGRAGDRSAVDVVLGHAMRGSTWTSKPEAIRYLVRTVRSSDLPAIRDARASTATKRSGGHARKFLHDDLQDLMHAVRLRSLLFGDDPDGWPEGCLRACSNLMP